MNFNTLYISKYRNELMGIAIISILCGHALTWSQVEYKPLYYIFDIGRRLLHTSGFLFLSAFGLTYSLSKDSNIIAFYKRRIYRLFIPFLVIMMPYYVYLDLYLEPNRGFYQLLCDLTTFTFWMFGNDGMWYVSLSLVLYLLFPFITKFCRYIGYLSTILLFIIISIIIFKIDSVFYSRIGIGIDRIPIFILGIYFGYLSLKQKNLNLIKLLVSIICLYVIAKYVSLFHKSIFENLAAQIENFLYLPISCIILSYIDKLKYKNIINTLSWMGKHSLEIYLSHFIFKRSIFYLFSDSNKLIITIASIIITLLLCGPIKRGVNHITSMIKL
jgi:peptidoglycan/LPS O-acetylase OafA/YrhL